MCIQKKWIFFENIPAIIIFYCLALNFRNDFLWSLKHKPLHAIQLFVYFSFDYKNWKNVCCAWHLDKFIGGNHYVLSEASQGDFYLIKYVYNVTYCSKNCHFTKYCRNNFFIGIEYFIVRLFSYYYGEDISLTCSNKVSQEIYKYAISKFATGTLSWRRLSLVGVYLQQKQIVFNSSLGAGN